MYASHYITVPSEDVGQMTVEQLTHWLSEFRRQIDAMPDYSDYEYDDHEKERELADAIQALESEFKTRGLPVPED